MTTKKKLLRTGYDLGMERSHVWVEHRAGLCVKGRSGRRQGWKGRKEESHGVGYLLSQLGL